MTRRLSVVECHSANKRRVANETLHRTRTVFSQEVRRTLPLSTLLLSVGGVGLASLMGRAMTFWKPGISMDTARPALVAFM
jgi:hypothetical protein